MAMVRRRRRSRAPRQIVGRHPEHRGPAPGAQKYAARARNSDLITRWADQMNYDDVKPTTKTADA